MLSHSCPEAHAIFCKCVYSLAAGILRIYITGMRYSFDPAKAASNVAKHGVSFDSVSEFEWEAALIQADTRHNEPRLVATAPIGDRVYVLVYSIERRSVRIISLRKANNKEIDRYEASLPPEHGC